MRADGPGLSVWGDGMEMFWNETVVMVVQLNTTLKFYFKLTQNTTKQSSQNVKAVTLGPAVSPGGHWILEPAAYPLGVSLELPTGRAEATAGSPQTKDLFTF